MPSMKRELLECLDRDGFASVRKPWAWTARGERAIGRGAVVTHGVPLLIVQELYYYVSHRPSHARRQTTPHHRY